MIEIINNSNVIARISIEQKLVDFKSKLSTYHFLTLKKHINDNKIKNGIVISSKIPISKSLTTIELNDK